MQQEIIVTSTDTDISDSMPTPGALLKAAREKTGMSIQDVAQKLYFTAAKITALEGDQYEKLVSPTFVQGYLRKYAALVELDGDKLVESYNGYLQSQPETIDQVIVPPNQSSRLVLGKKPPKWILPSSLFVVAVLVLAGVVYFGLDPIERAERPNLLQAEEIPMPVNTSPAISTAPINNAPIENVAVIDDNSETTNIQSSMTNETDDMSGVAFSENNSTYVSRDVSRANTAAVAPSAEFIQTPDQLVFVFADRCWLQVSDGSGAVIHAELHEQGDEPVIVNGVAPFSVMLGNARVATVALNGTTVDFEIRPGYDTARFIIQ